MIVFGVDELSSVEVGLGAAQAMGVVRFAKVGQEPREVDAACGAQLGDDALVVPLLDGEVLHLVGYILFVGCGDVVGEAAEVPAAVVSVVGVGTGAYTYILRPLPVAAVVAGVVAGEGKVGNLVVLVTGCKEFLSQEFEGAYTLLLVDGGYEALLLHTPQTGALLISEVVGRDMLHTERDGLVKAIGPVVECLAGEAIDEVDADVGEPSLLQAVHGIDGLLGCMSTPYEAQGAVVKGLYAQAYAVDGEGAQPLYVLFGEVVGVGFEGELFELKIER